MNKCIHKTSEVLLYPSLIHSPHSCLYGSVIYRTLLMLFIQLTVIKQSVTALHLLIILSILSVIQKVHFHEIGNAKLYKTHKNRNCLNFP